MNRRFAIPTLLTLLLVLGTLPGVAQELPGFGETIDVRVINVEVVVTDKDDVPVLGLSPEDFRLYVDGEEVPIDYFTEIRGGVAVEPEVAEGEEAGQRPASLPSVAPGEPVPTSYLLFIDEYFAINRDRNRVLEELIEQLPLLGPEDRMAVVAFNGERVEMLTSWTGSTTKLTDVLQDARFRDAYGLQRASELRFFENTRTDTSFDRGGFDLSFEEQQYARQLAGQVERSVLAATATLRGFASPPGRKVMLLLSGGWPYSVAEYTVNQVASDRAVLDPTLPRGTELLQPLVRTANLLGYTIYPVDVPGLATTPVTAAEARGGFVTAPAPVQPEDSQAPQGPASRLVREYQQEVSLQYVARQTGGRALINGQRTEAFEKAVADTRTYYWLGFTSERKSHEDPRNIKVDVEAKGLSVRSRASYQDLSRREEVNLAVESALLFGSPPGYDDLPVAVGEPRKDGRKFVQIPLAVAIPTDAMTVVPQGEKFEARLELRVAAVSEKGDMSEVPVIPLSFSFEEAPAKGKFVPYQTAVKLRDKKQRVVVALYDTLGTSLYSKVLDIDPDELRDKE